MIDHFGYVPQPAGEASASAATVRRLVEGGNTWVKLSGAYIQSPGPDYADADAWARQLLELAPDRMLWGSDWPHTSLTARKPDTARLLDRLSDWTDEPRVRHQVLVTNPDRLYWRD